MSKVGGDILETLTGKKAEETVAKKETVTPSTSEKVDDSKMAASLGEVVEKLEKSEEKIGPSSDEPIKTESTGDSPEPALDHEVSSVRASSGFAYVSKLYTKGQIVVSESEDEELIQVQTLAPNVPQAKVHVDMSMTVNMGDYNSVKIGVGIELPSYLPELEDAYTAAQSWVSNRLTEEISKVKSHKAAKRGS